jgi:plastocyanin domain-containing protein
MISFWIVAGAFAAIFWVNWYFLFGQKPVARATAVAGGEVQEVRITVQGGYTPAVAKVSKGKPVRLVFDRLEKSPCSDEVVISKAGIRRFLKPFEQTAVEFTPVESGTYEFTCGMNMLRGRVEVEG